MKKVLDSLNTCQQFSVGFNWRESGIFHLTW
jgi:hypothetical protein